MRSATGFQFSGVFSNHEASGPVFGDGPRGRGPCYAGSSTFELRGIMLAVRRRHSTISHRSALLGALPHFSPLLPFTRPQAQRLALRARRSRFPLLVASRTPCGWSGDVCARALGCKHVPPGPKRRALSCPSQYSRARYRALTWRRCAHIFARSVVFPARGARRVVLVAACQYGAPGFLSLRPRSPS